MERTRRILLAEMAGALLVAAAVVLLFECGVLMAGALAPDTQVVFVATAVMQLVTISAIPLAMYLFRIPYVGRQLTAGGGDAPARLLLWGSVRMTLLCAPMTVNVILYYLTSMTVSFAYMAVILAISLAFVYPSVDRCRHETARGGES